MVGWEDWVSSGASGLALGVSQPFVFDRSPLRGVFGQRALAGCFP